MTRVLVVDDVPAMAEQYAYDLKRVGGYETRIASSGKEALETLAWDEIDCVILDLEMPDVDGFEVLRRLQQRGSRVPVIVYTGTGSYDRCVRAIQLGAYGFIDKGEPVERVAQEVSNALERRRLEDEVAELRRDLGESELVGSSGPMQSLRKEIARVAKIPSPVLIVGESGTGKERVARELHRLFARDNVPFVAVNCAALPENLVESELFGHERGAFTGANRTHRGAFERAAKGTLFLDEVGELPAAVQAKLLRVLEEGQLTRLGGESPTPVSARVITATHRDLEAEVAAGRFRDDLYYRINIHVLRVPPLRDRRSDIAELAAHFVTTLCARFGMPEKRIDPEVIDALMAHDWRRNNIRELRNVIERMIIAADGDIGVAHIPADLERNAGPAGAPARTFQELKAEAERRIIVTALEQNDWHITRTAQALGLADHASLLKIMRRHKLKRPQ